MGEIPAAARGDVTLQIRQLCSDVGKSPGLIFSSGRIVRANASIVLACVMSDMDSNSLAASRRGPLSSRCERHQSSGVDAAWAGAERKARVKTQAVNTGLNMTLLILDQRGLEPDRIFVFI